MPNPTSYATLEVALNQRGLMPQLEALATERGAEAAAAAEQTLTAVEQVAVDVTDKAAQVVADRVAAQGAAQDAALAKQQAQGAVTGQSKQFDSLAAMFDVANASLAQFVLAVVENPLNKSENGTFYKTTLPGSVGWQRTDNETVSSLGTFKRSTRALLPQLRDRRLPSFPINAENGARIGAFGIDGLWLWRGLTVATGGRESRYASVVTLDGGRAAISLRKSDGLAYSWGGHGAPWMEAGEYVVTAGAGSRDSSWLSPIKGGAGQQILRVKAKDGSVDFEPSPELIAKIVPVAPGLTAQYVASFFGFDVVLDFVRVNSKLARFNAPVPGKGLQAFYVRIDRIASGAFTRPSEAAVNVTGRCIIILGLGQSLADGGTIGETHGIVGLPLPLLPQNALMLDSPFGVKSPNVDDNGDGILDTFDKTAALGLVPIKEAYFSLRNDTQGTASSFTLITDAYAASGRAVDVVYQGCGHGGRTQAAIGPGGMSQPTPSRAYDNSLLMLESIVEKLGDYQTTGFVPFVTMTQGEADAGITARATYTGQVIANLDAYNPAIKSRTGQTEDVWMVIDQLCAAQNATGASPIALAQTDAADQHPRIIVSGPKYQFTDYAGFQVHPVSTRHIYPNGYNVIGEMNARAAGFVFDQFRKGWVADKARWKHTRCISAQLVGNTVVLKFEAMMLPIRINTAAIMAAAAYGFVVRDDTATVTITNVAVTAPDEITLTLTAAPTGANRRVSYAYEGGSVAASTPGGRRFATWGNICDSDPYVSRVHRHPTTGAAYPMPNWLLIFERML